MTIRDSLMDWAQRTINGAQINGKDYIGFNEISKHTNTQYYLQSPLDKITNNIDTLVLGINPGGTEPGVTEMKSPEDYLKGNKYWENRFNENHISPDWAAYFGRGHKMICGNQVRDNLMLDNDIKTVWSNLTPFATREVSQLKSVHWEAGLRSTAELITIL